MSLFGDNTSNRIVVSLQDGKEYRKKLNTLSGQILQNLLAVVPSTYNSETPSTNYALHLKRIATELARIRIEAENLYWDRGLDTLRPEYLYQKFGYQIQRDGEFFPVSYFSDEQYRRFLKSIIGVIFEVPSVANIKKALDLFTGQDIEILPLGDLTRYPNANVSPIDQYTLQINLDSDKLTTLYKLENVVAISKFILDIIKPAHVLADYRVIVRDAFNNTPGGNVSLSIPLLRDKELYNLRGNYYEDFRRFTHDPSTTTILAFNSGNLLNQYSREIGVSGSYLNSPMDLTTKRFSLYQLGGFFVPGSSLLNAGYSLELNRSEEGLLNRFDLINPIKYSSISGSSVKLPTPSGNTAVPESYLTLRLAGDSSGYSQFDALWGTVLADPTPPVELKQEDIRSRGLYQPKGSSVVNFSGDTLNKNFLTGFQNLTYSADLDRYTYSDLDVSVKSNNANTTGQSFLEQLDGISIDLPEDTYQMVPENPYILLNYSGLTLNHDQMFDLDSTYSYFRFDLEPQETLPTVSEYSAITLKVSSADDMGRIYTGIMLNSLKVDKIYAPNYVQNPLAAPVSQDLNHTLNMPRVVSGAYPVYSLVESSSSVLNNDTFVPGYIFSDDTVTIAVSGAALISSSTIAVSGATLITSGISLPPGMNVPSGTFISDSQGIYNIPAGTVIPYGTYIPRGTAFSTPNASISSGTYIPSGTFISGSTYSIPKGLYFSSGDYIYESSPNFIVSSIQSSGSSLYIPSGTLIPSGSLVSYASGSYILPSGTSIPMGTAIPSGTSLSLGGSTVYPETYLPSGSFVSGNVFSFGSGSYIPPRTQVSGSSISTYTPSSSGTKATYSGTHYLPYNTFELLNGTIYIK